MKKLLFGILIFTLFSMAGKAYASSITLLSPNGGEVFQSGQQVTVTWSTSDLSSQQKMAISVYNSATGDHYYLTGNPISEGTLNDGIEVFNISQAFNTRVFQTTGIPSGNNYTISIITNPTPTGPTIIDYSDAPFTINSSVILPPPTKDSTPRVAMWYGKVNQHADSQGNWLTDSDGISGAGSYSQWGSEGYGDRKLQYCQKFYPNTTSVEDYKNETITTWRERNNVGGPYTLDVMTTKCVNSQVIEPPNTICSSTSNPSITVISPNGGEMYKDGQQVTVKWISCNVTDSSIIPFYLDVYDANNNLLGFMGLGSSTNDGVETTILHKVGYLEQDPQFVNVTFGKHFKIHLVATDNIYALTAPDYSDDFFTINKTVINTDSSVGCTSAYGYSSITGQKCAPQVLPLPPVYGCSLYSKYSSTTGQPCLNSSITIQTPNSSFISPIPTSATFKRVLKLGSVGDDVKVLQSLLGITADGIYGRGTVAKVKAWQIYDGLKADGVFGAQSRATLDAPR